MRKLYLAIGLIAILGSAAGVWFMLRPEIIPLTIKYVEGEKMTYEVAMTVNVMGQEQSQTATFTLEVLDVEDGVYTVNHTVTALNETNSLTIKFDESGRLVDVHGLSPEQAQIFSFFVGLPGYGMYFSKEEVQVGESWDVPVDVRTEDFNLTGTIYNEVEETEKLTVPAGTYDAFKLQIEPSDLTMVYVNATAPIQLTVFGHEWFEKGTCLLVQSEFDVSVRVSMLGQTITISAAIQMTLTEHG